MSFLKKSLEKRIQELEQSIEAQKTELAAYHQVLALESGKPAEVVMTAAAASEPAKAPKKKAAKEASKKAAKKSVPASSTSSKPVSTAFNGSRSDFVAAAIKDSGSAGITPLEISAAFAARKVAVSKNLVYNVLSLMFKRKLVRKDDGRYYPLAAAAPTSPSAKPASSPTAPKKSRISEEGMRRIIAATKKRWALKRAGKGK